MEKPDPYADWVLFQGGEGELPASFALDEGTAQGLLGHRSAGLDAYQHGLRQTGIQLPHLVAFVHQGQIHCFSDGSIRHSQRLLAGPPAAVWDGRGLEAVARRSENPSYCDSASR